MKLEKIKNILWNCEKAIDDYANEVGAANEIICFIEQLQEQYADLKKHYNNMFECHCNREQVEKLQNNWNELKQWLDPKGWDERFLFLDTILEKMEELEGKK